MKISYTWEASDIQVGVGARHPKECSLQPTFHICGANRGDCLGVTYALVSAHHFITFPIDGRTWLSQSEMAKYLNDVGYLPMRAS